VAVDMALIRVLVVPETVVVLAAVVAHIMVVDLQQPDKDLLVVMAAKAFHINLAVAVVLVLLVFLELVAELRVVMVAMVQALTLHS
jgi:hypothetical protein